MNVFKIISASDQKNFHTWVSNYIKNKKVISCTVLRHNTEITPTGYFEAYIITEEEDK